MLLLAHGKRQNGDGHELDCLFLSTPIRFEGRPPQDLGRVLRAGAREGPGQGL